MYGTINNKHIHNINIRTAVCAYNILKFPSKSVHTKAYALISAVADEMRLSSISAATEKSY